MEYKLTYKCVNCKTRWNETINEEDLKKAFQGRCGCSDENCDVMSIDFLYVLFTTGIDFHKCYADGTTSYGKCISIRPGKTENE
jgi:hypothetical protein